MSSRRKLSSANFPFWLLIAAWFCANVPSMATAHAFGWMKGAQHFSHYAELRRSVASLLAGQPTEAAPQVAVATTPAHPSPPAVPLEDPLKKIDLSLTPTPLRLIATRSAVRGDEPAPRLPGDPSIEVPYPPPRLRGEC